MCADVKHRTQTYMHTQPPIEQQLSKKQPKNIKVYTCPFRREIEKERDWRERHVTLC
jgi:hypothetical protein